MMRLFNLKLCDCNDLFDWSIPLEYVYLLTSETSFQLTVSWILCFIKRITFCYLLFKSLDVSNSNDYIELGGL